MDFIFDAVSNKLSADMASVSITNEYMPFIVSLFSGSRIKNTFNPVYCDYIACPTFRILRPCPVSVVVYFQWNPSTLNIFAFENCQWRNCTSITANTFNNRYPLRASLLSFIDLLLFCVTNDICVLSVYTNIESLY